MKTFRLVLFALAISVSTALFAQTTNTPTPESKFQDIVIADYNNMNLGPKLNQLTTIRIFSDQTNDRSNSGIMSSNDFVSTWLLYQTNILLLNHSEYDNESIEDKAAYEPYHPLVIAGERPTVLEILNYCKK